jgi:galactonate dehydratase
VKSTIRLEQGFLVVPSSPGIGIELVDGIEETYPAIPRPYVTRVGEDGSVFDQ